jgi:uncharacterized protein YcgI (DUF1989 family)
LRKGEAKAVQVAKGQVIKITCNNGGQLADMVFPSYHQGLTLDNLRRFVLREGDLLYDFFEEAVLLVLSIKSDANTNILYPGCRRKLYETTFNKKKDGCRELLARALGIPQIQLPGTINLFMDFNLDCTELSFETDVSKAKGGDYVRFRVLKDCIIAVSACPCEPNSCGTEGDIVVEVT